MYPGIESTKDISDSYSKYDGKIASRYTYTHPNANNEETLVGFVVARRVTRLVDY